MRYDKDSSSDGKKMDYAEHKMKGNRSFEEIGNDSPNSIRRAGGEDPRRYDAKIAIDRSVRDHDMSGYNHNATSSQPSNGGRENEMYMKEHDVKAMKMGTPAPDGTYKY
jgi:hypothetical protein